MVLFRHIFVEKASNTPLQETGHPACGAASCAIFDPCGIRQMLMQERRLAHCSRK